MTFYLNHLIMFYIPLKVKCKKYNGVEKLDNFILLFLLNMTKLNWLVKVKFRSQKVYSSLY